MRDAAVVRRQLTSEVLHGAGLNYFMRAGMARRRGEGTPVAVHYGVYVPRLPAWPQDCIIDIRPTPVPLHEYAPVYERGKKAVCACEHVCMYVCGARKRLFVDIRRWNIRVMRPAENRTDSPHIGSDIVVRINAG